MQVSGLGSVHPPRVFRHYQNQGGEVLRRDEDDYQSPVQPARYIELRIMPSIEFYRERIPRYARHRYLLQISLLLCVSAATLLSSYGEDMWRVVVLSSGASVLTSWSEFGDTARKTEVTATVSVTVAVISQVAEGLR